MFENAVSFQGRKQLGLRTSGAEVTDMVQLRESGALFSFFLALVPKKWRILGLEKIY